MSADKSKRLFEEFPPVSTTDWEEQIRKDLKGADYSKKLNWMPVEGFTIKPYYRSEDLNGLIHNTSESGKHSYVKGNQIKGNNWEIRQDIYVDDIEIANQKARFVLHRGINSIGFILPENKLSSPEDLLNLLDKVDITKHSIHFVTDENPLKLIDFLLEAGQKNNIDIHHIKGSVDYDPLGHLTINGDFCNNRHDDLALLISVLKKAASELPSFRVIGINGFYFRNAGAGVVQELAFSLSMLSDYLSFVTDEKPDVNTVSKFLQFNFGIGENYFMEIAKIRAARYLIANVLKAFGANENARSTFIHSVTSAWNKTIYDPYVNILRTTSEAMAAIIGGTDSLVVKPFDSAYHKPGTFSGRLSRNVQIVLKEEAYFDKIADPSAGSYYVESLTNSLIEEAWKLFLSLEEKGGYQESLQKGFVQQLIRETVDERKKKIAARKEVLLGTNQYPNRNEQVLDNIDFSIAFPDQSSVKKKTVEPIPQMRAAADLENLRLAVEKLEKEPPKVFLLPCGDLTMRNARAGFAANFFAVAGYRIIENPGFSHPRKGAEAALKADADIVVVCSSDAEYAEMVPEVNQVIDHKAIIVVAGAPPCMEDLKAKGIQHFIHMKSDLVETLKLFHSLLGIN